MEGDPATRAMERVPDKKTHSVYFEVRNEAHPRIDGPSRGAHDCRRYRAVPNSASAALSGRSLTQALEVQAMLVARTSQDIRVGNAKGFAGKGSGCDLCAFEPMFAAVAEEIESALRYRVDIAPLGESSIRKRNHV